MVCQYVDEGLKLLQARLHLEVVVVRLVEEVLPLIQLLVELGAPLCHEFEALLLELVQGDFVHFVHHFDVVDDPHFGSQARRSRQELARCHASITGQWIVVLTVVNIVLVGLAVALQFSLFYHILFDLHRGVVIQRPDTDLATTDQRLRQRWRGHFWSCCHIIGRYLLLRGCFPRTRSLIGVGSRCRLVVVRRMP